jgi:hypothetical protein
VPQIVVGRDHRVRGPAQPVVLASLGRRIAAQVCHMAAQVSRVRQVGEIGSQAGPRPGRGDQRVVDFQGTAPGAHEPVVVGGHLADDLPAGLGQGLVDAPQVAPGAFRTPLAVDDAPLPGALRAHRRRLDEHLPVLERPAGMLAAPLGHLVRLVRDRLADDHVEPRAQQRGHVALGHHARVGHHRDALRAVLSRERLEHRQDRLRLGLVPLERVHLQRETLPRSQQTDHDLRLQAALFGEPGLSEPVALMGLPVEGLCRRSSDADVGRVRAGQSGLGGPRRRHNRVG